MTTTMPLPTEVHPTGSHRLRRVARSAVILLVFLGIGTYLVGRVVGLDPIEARINGLVWCPGNDVSMKPHGHSDGRGGTRTNGDSLVCRDAGVIVREVNIPRVMLTDLVVSAGVALTVMTVGIGSLLAIGRLRRHRRPSPTGGPTR